MFVNGSKKNEQAYHYYLPYNLYINIVAFSVWNLLKQILDLVQW
jgi:hypothetical protein